MFVCVFCVSEISKPGKGYCFKKMISPVHLCLGTVIPKYQHLSFGFCGFLSFCLFCLLFIFYLCSLFNEFSC